jgi:ribosomal-protein-alanine N-acetyltransferase
LKILETERIILREWQPEDIPQVIDMYADPEVMRYIGRGIPYTPEEVERMVLAAPDFYRKYGYGMWPMILKETGQIIGRCGLKYWEELGETEIGYLLKKAYWGQGLASEAAQAVLAYAFDTLKLKRIISIAQSPNLASIKVMQKIGLTFDREMNFKEQNVVVYKKDV